MDKLNLGIAKLIQFFIIVFFAFILSFYFGSLLLIPLALLIAVIDILSAIGFNGIIATLFAIPIVLWIGFKIYSIESLFQTILETGIKIYRIGLSQNKIFEDITKKIKPDNNSTTTNQDVKPA